MKRFLKHGLLIFLLLGVMTPVAAQTAPSGVVSVPVSDDSESARRAAIAGAMGQLIIRLTGLPMLPESPVGQRLRSEAERFVLGFSYREVPLEPSVDSVVAPPPDTPLTETRLETRFALQDIERELVRAGVEIWPNPAPSVLVWLAVERDGDRRLADAMTDAEWREQLQSQAAALGFRVIFPLMDLEDLSSVSYADIAVGFADPVRKASLRYGVNDVLAGRIQVLADGRVNARWMQLGETPDVERWSDSAEQASPLLRQAVDELVGGLRRNYAYLPDLSAQRTLLVSIRNIATLAAQARVMERLEAISGVERVSPTIVSDQRVTFALAITVEEARVRAALERDTRLIRDEDGDGFSWR